MTLERDSRLGKYVIRARIGAGGMGAVYRAYDTVLKREVAIKTILADKVTERDFLARFRREALAISQLDDPHIVRLIDFVEGDPSQGEPPYMVMELLRGQDLHSIIRKGPVPIERAVDILLETCAAVGTCHRYGFVHRDLKATNIFVTEYNAVETAKVLDFGVAKFWGEGPVGEGTDPSEVTRKGIAVGTPEYLAPEILRGGLATPHSDQYALGILLYAALTGGRKPFEAQKNGEFRDLHLLQAIMKGEHLGPRSYRADIPEALEQVIERAMAHDPELRFSSVHSLGEALLKWASPRARLQWTGHFTSAPKPAVVQHSMSISPEQAAYVRKVAAEARPAPSRGVAAPLDTRKVGPRELRDLLATDGVADTEEGQPVPVTTSVTQEDQPLDSPSLVVVEDGPSAVPVWREPSGRPQPVVLSLPRDPQVRVISPAPTNLPDEPSMPTAAGKALGLSRVLVAGVLFAAAVVGIAVVMRGTEHVSDQRTSAPAAVPAGVPGLPAGQPAAAAAPPPPSPEPSLRSEKAAPVVAPAAAPEHLGEVPAAPDRKSRARRHPKPKVDENGIGIPSD